MLVHDFCGIFDELLDASRATFKGGKYTVGGNALAKHGLDRVGSPLAALVPPGLRGKPGAKNNLADELIMDILTDPKTATRTYRNRTFGPVIEYIGPDGRGLRYTTDGIFIAFLD